MYRLLLVDDEPIILNSYYEMLSDTFKNELNVDKCQYSSQIPDKLAERIDILITDIYMPKMTGYDVNQLVCRKWKDCRTIFITGNESMESARKVIRDSKNVVDYILKLEDTEVLIQAVRKAIYELDHIMQEKGLRENIRQYMSQAMPILRRDFFKEFLTSTACSSEELKESFSRLDFAFRAEAPVIPLLGAFRAKDGRVQRRVDTTFLIVDQIVSEYLSPKFIQYGFPLNDSIPLGMWCIQLVPNGTISPEEAVGYIHSYLDLIQEHSERFSDMTVSFILSHDMLEWQKLPQVYNRMLNLAQIYGHLENQIFFIEEAEEIAELSKLEEEKKTRLLYQSLQQSLVSGDREAFCSVWEELTTQPRESLVQLHFEICSCFTTAMNILSLPASTYNGVCTFLLNIRLGESSPDTLLEQYLTAAKPLFQTSKNNNKKITTVVDTVVQYIDAHMGEDLSLTKVSTMVFHNPSYFSKLFKQTMGIGYCEYVAKLRMTRAQNLLCTTSQKIGDISRQVGFDSIPYFNKTFKKTFGCTPQEYREKSISLG